MPLTPVVTLLLLLAPLRGQMGPLDRPRPGRDKLPAQIEQWLPGMPIPSEALRLQTSGGCLLLFTDSEAIIREVNNYDFLIALASHPGADATVVEMAVRRALLLKGPTVTFGDLRREYESKPDLTNLRVHQRLLLRMGQRHVWVRGIDVEPAAFGIERSRRVLEEIASRLKGGERWQTVYNEYSARYPGRDGGTSIGNFGSYVASEVRDEENGGLDLLVPAYHMQSLLQARAGDVLILTAKPGAYGFEVGHGPFLILWQVHEIYLPDARHGE